MKIRNMVLENCNRWSKYGSGLMTRARAIDRIQIQPEIVIEPPREPFHNCQVCLKTPGNIGASKISLASLRQKLWLRRTLERDGNCPKEEPCHNKKR